MAGWALYIILGMSLAVAGFAAVATGWWRYSLWLWTISPAKMTVARRSLRITDPADVERVNTILGSFITGFNRAIACPSEQAWQCHCASIPSLYRPFAHEGAAMGHILRRFFRYDAGEFERTIVKPRPEFRYLYYVGLGFWWGLRHVKPAKLMRLVEGLDPLHRYLCFDGYGFAHAFFDYPKDPQALTRLDDLKGYARNAAYQGVGRAFFFLYMGDAKRMIESIQSLGTHACDAAAGAGLATAFVNPDRLERAQRLASQMPSEWQAHFHLGMCFGFKARSINDLDEFEANLSRLPKATQEAIWASIRECDRAELLVRADAEVLADGYELWRHRVTQWLSDNIEYPMRSVSVGTRVGSYPPPLPRGESQGGRLRPIDEKSSRRG